MSNDDKKRRIKSPRLFDIICIGLSSTLIVSGLFNEEHFVSYSLFGPIAIFVIGVFIHVCLIEYKNSYSEFFDKKIEPKIKLDLSTSEKHSRYIVMSILFYVFILSILLAYYILGNLSIKIWKIKSESLITILLFISSVSLAIFVVRFIRNFGQKLETNVTLIDDVQGNEEYIKWLKSSKDKSSLTRDFKNFVNEERMVFVDEIKRNSVEFLDEFFSSVWCKSCSSTVFVRGDSQRKLACPSCKSDIVGVEFRTSLQNVSNLFSNCKSLDFKRLEKAVKSTRNNDLVERHYALFLLPSALEIMRILLSSQKSSNESILNIVNTISSILVALNANEIYIPEKMENPSSHEINSSLYHVEFLRKISNFVNDFEHIDWNPWLILEIRPLICIIEQINFEESQFSGIKYSDEIFSALVECLADFGSNNSPIRFEMKDIKDKIKVSPDDYLSVRSFESIFDITSDRLTKTSTKYQLILMTWLMFNLDNEQSIGTRCSR